MPFKTSNATTTYDLTKLKTCKDYDYVKEESIMVLVTAQEIPLRAIVEDTFHKYRIVQHTTQVERTYNKPLFVYICEEL